MRIAILDYSSSDLDVINAPDELDTTEKVEEWLEDAGGYRLSDISYMCNVERINIA